MTATMLREAPAEAGNDMRYWSMCTNEYRKPYPVTVCAADEDVALADDGTFTFHFLAQNQRNDAFATTNFSVTILAGGGETQEVAIAEISNVTTAGGQFGFRATLADLPPAITSLPVYTATDVVDGAWNWTLSTNVPVTEGQADVELPVEDKCMISLGKPPILD